MKFFVDKLKSIMPRMAALLCAAALCLSPAAGNADSGEFRILTSFYPVYLLTINIAGGIDGVRVDNMAQQNVGCLHDYTLRTGDMRMITAADVVVINGAGMESFVDRIINSQNKPVIDSSIGIELIEDEDEHEGGLHHVHDHDEDVNAHFWMSPRQARLQVANIAAGLIELDPAHADEYAKNAAEFDARLTALDTQLTELLSTIKGSQIVTSHPAFEYLARDYGIDIVASLGQEPGEMPRTRDMAELVDTVRDMGISAVFVEKAYNERAAQVLARETGIDVYTLDSLTSGELDPAAYERGILEDAQILMEALKDAGT